MYMQAIDRQNRIEVTRIMPVVNFPAPKSLKRSFSAEASIFFVLGAALVVWTTRQDLLETCIAYYLIGMSTLYVVTRKKSAD